MLTPRQKLRIHIGVNIFTPDEKLAERRARNFVASLSDEEVEYALGLSYFATPTGESPEEAV